jgi:hypothetical protein
MEFYLIHKETCDIQSLWEINENTNLAAPQLTSDGSKEKAAFFRVDPTRIKNQVTVTKPHNTRQNVLVTLFLRRSQPIASRCP